MKYAYPAFNEGRCRFSKRISIDIASSIHRFLGKMLLQTAYDNTSENGLDGSI
jgi:hypothetical protein